MSADIKASAWRWLNTGTFRTRLPADGMEGHWNPLFTRATLDAAVTAAVERCAVLCDERAAKIAAEAERAATSKPDEVSALRAMAWQIEVTAAAIRATLPPAPKE